MNTEKQNSFVPTALRHYQCDTGIPEDQLKPSMRVLFEKNGLTPSTAKKTHILSRLFNYLRP